MAALQSQLRLEVDRPGDPKFTNMLLFSCIISLCFQVPCCYGVSDGHGRLCMQTNYFVCSSVFRISRTFSLPSIRVTDRVTSANNRNLARFSRSPPLSVEFYQTELYRYLVFRADTAKVNSLIIHCGFTA